ncbi:hypothetical protein AVEN_98645-1 [Araneus ventricosus]|uniref:Uncharacterized protein n=1 Tax=Araneus ventricosus TaxID=182803 RepID=A0A4Y2U951_ARAVE|nr:hypothetical protein AVEN_160713-1 [Araneus ventricosus]GBO08120.1 hypothetical protein AVEN_98645-1 [Araneus ventricosus]
MPRKFPTKRIGEKAHLLAAIQILNHIAKERLKHPHNRSVSKCTISSFFFLLAMGIDGGRRRFICCKKTRKKHDNDFIPENTKEKVRSGNLVASPPTMQCERVILAATRYSPTTKIEATFKRTACRSSASHPGVEEGVSGTYSH